MARPAHRQYVLDTNCFIDASRDAETGAALEGFSAREASRLYLSAVVASELRAGAGRGRVTLERVVFGPYLRRGRVLIPSLQAWDALGPAQEAVVGVGFSDAVDEALRVRAIRWHMLDWTSWALTVSVGVVLAVALAVRVPEANVTRDAA